MTVPAHKRRFPKVLADKLSIALHATRPLGDQASEWLETYRENLRRAFVEGGLNAEFSGLGEGIPAEYLHSIRMLHDAFEELHKFRDDPSRYMSASVYREAQRTSAGGSKVAGDTNTKIAEEIMTSYLNAKRGEKGKLKKLIADRHSVSERHVDNLIRELKDS